MLCSCMAVHRLEPRLGFPPSVHVLYRNIGEKSEAESPIHENIYIVNMLMHTVPEFYPTRQCYYEC